MEENERAGKVLRNVAARTGPQAVSLNKAILCGIQLGIKQTVEGAIMLIRNSS